MSAVGPTTTMPLIGLSGRRWPIADVPRFDYVALEGEEVDVHLSEYPKALAALGALPVQLNRNVDPAAIVLRLDGLVMTGGSDPDPALYGEAAHPQLGEVDRARDDWEIALIRAALAQHLPMLCVCRGAQLLNIALGGTLHQHLDGAATHGRWDIARTTRCHSVAFTPGSTAARLFGSRADTNSLHHQGVKQAADGVVVTGRSDDGTVEAFELIGRPEVLALQWHPEMLAGAPDPAFVWLVDAAVRRHSE
jgi:putative glutamine amidotransferase